MLPIDLESFKSSIAKRGGLARQNYFSVYFPTPVINLSGDSILSNLAAGNTNLLQAFNDPRDISILCETVNLPGRQIATNEYATAKKAEKRPYGYIDEDVTMSFLLTEDYYIKDIMDVWQAQVFDYENHRINYKSNYAKDVVIQQLSKNGTPIYSVKLINAFPTSVSSIELSNTGENSVQRITVTFSYDTFEPLGLLSGASEVVGGIVEGVQKSGLELNNTIEKARKVFGSLPKL